MTATKTQKTVPIFIDQQKFELEPGVYTAAQLLELAGEDPAEGTDVTVSLKPIAPDAKVRLGYSTARPLVVEATVPRFVAEIPKFNTEAPLFFRVALGETKGIPFFVKVFAVYG